MKILLVTSRFPWPVRRGNQLRTVQMAEWLASEHEVTVLAPAGPRDVELPRGLAFGVECYRFSRGSAVLGVAASLGRGTPLQNGMYDQPSLHQALATRAGSADLTILQLARLHGAAPAVGRALMAVDFVDSLALNFARRARFDRWWMRPLWRAEARCLRRCEHALLARASAAWVVCERDRQAMLEGLAPCEAGKLGVLPLAVSPPLDSAPRQEETAGDAPTIVLTGNLGYFPTAEGAGWFVHAIWPTVLSRCPRARLIVAGSRPSRALRDAVRGVGGRLLESPPSVAEVLAQATVAVAPLRCGSGVPIKILEAWGAGVPVVATAYAAAGTTAVGGRDLLLADGAADWAAAIDSLLTDRYLRQRLSRSGLTRLGADYGPYALRRRLLADVAGLQSGRSSDTA
ncbi:MAG: glycosyltransferase [Acidobacteriota bacterium]